MAEQGVRVGQSGHGQQLSKSGVVQQHQVVQPMGQQQPIGQQQQINQQQMVQQQPQQVQQHAIVNNNINTQSGTRVENIQPPLQ